MALKQSLNMKLGQSLTMTPQLQQAIRLLQLSTLELQTEIQQALESNPMLDIDESEETSSSDDGAERERNAAEAEEPQTPTQESTAISDEMLNADNNSKDQIPEELPVDSGWDDIYEPSYAAAQNRGDDNTRDFLEYQADTSSDNLRDFLLEQLHLMPISEQDRLIGASIIDSIDENGYLRGELEEILQGLNSQHTNPEENIELDELLAVLHMVQQFDPPGIAARDPGESMWIQMQHMDPDIPFRSIAMSLVKDHLDILASHDYPRLKKLLQISQEELLSAITLIQTLHPRPGSVISTNSTQYIVPDVFVRKLSGVWRVELNSDIAPKLCINSMYSNLVKRADKSDDNSFLRNNLQEARWFIKSLQSRNETLLKVATSIVQRQRGFLEYGEEAMKPMVLRDIAELLEMHESTISRVTTQKFMHTPRGIFEFKYFFSSHVGTADGGECSATAIRAMVRKLISEENPEKPLSDNKIASILVDKGINVARRTVAKYREAIAIPPSNERKRLN